MAAAHRLPAALFGDGIVQAPMAGLSDAALVSACCQAGVVGSLGAGGLQPDAMRREIVAIRDATDRPFNINLFVIDERQGASVPELEQAALAAYCRDHDLPFALPERFAPRFRDQLDAVLEAAPPIASFAFGIPDRADLAVLRARGAFVIGTATSRAELEAWQESGADAVCVQGVEAGGHRGGFLLPDERLGLDALLSELAPIATVPLIAAGAIMNGADMVAKRRLGAQAVQMGTAFLCCDEAPTPAAYRRALLSGRDGTQTVLTQAFSGRWARGLRNDFIRQFETAPVSPYPIRNALTQPLRKAATARGDTQNMSLWAGTGVGAIRAMPVAELVAALRAEIATAQPAST
ncbi:nitronate monooxygenase [Acetobacteraceae bacterium KSS8]|uniref:Propionate 3-nitronate monooxygenase n=1 Tax=Endosaccharibacter trunci TaxID=2812733 RepID=A0ABT1W7X1_9PROT|nr:nitronate monooxygenase [Acetobacteraceae bacterium KSS8]